MEVIFFETGEVLPFNEETKQRISEIEKQIRDKNHVVEVALCRYKVIFNFDDYIKNLPSSIDDYRTTLMNNKKKTIEKLTYVLGREKDWFGYSTIDTYTGEIVYFDDLKFAHPTTLEELMSIIEKYQWRGKLGLRVKSKFVGYDKFGNNLYCQRHIEEKRKQHERWLQDHEYIEYINRKQKDNKDKKEFDIFS